jgi:hypothetical protein
MADSVQITVKQTPNGMAVLVEIPQRILLATGATVLDEAIRALRIEQSRRK